MDYDQDKLHDALHELRLLLLQECEDGKFRQVALDAEQFKKVSDASVAHMPDEQPDGLTEGKQIVHIHLTEEWELDADLFLGLGSISEDCADCE